MANVDSLLAKAMNNSSPAEAAQALKMAASVMQREGINPKDILSVKGDASPEELREVKRVALYWYKKAEKLGVENQFLETRVEDLVDRHHRLIRENHKLDESLDYYKAKVIQQQWRFHAITFSLMLLSAAVTFWLTHG